MKRLWFILLALSLGLNVGLIAVILMARTREAAFRSGHEQRSGRGEHRRGEGQHLADLPPQQLTEMHMRRLERHIELTESQREEITAILNEYMPRVVGQREKINEIRTELGLHIAIPELDPGGFRRLVDSLNQEQTRLDSLVMESMLAEAALLTPEQRGQYAKTMPWGRPMGPARGGRK
jgi:Spy/CpxP family protein refolding chaperone